MLKHNSTKRLLIISFMLIGLLTGCKTPQGTNWQSSTQKLNLQCNQIKLEVFQTISNNELSSACMAADEKLNIYFIISMSCPDEPKCAMFYDKKNISGYYTFLGTFTYESKDGSTRTVPACMLKKEFEAAYKCDKETLIDSLNKILSYNQVK